MSKKKKAADVIYQFLNPGGHILKNHVFKKSKHKTLAAIIDPSTYVKDMIDEKIDKNDKWSNQAKLLLEQKEYQSVIELCNEQSSKDESYSSAQADYYKAKAYICSNEKIDEARRLCIRLLGMNPKYIENYRSEIRDLYDRCTETLLSDFTNNTKFTDKYSFGERQFLFIVQNEDKISGCVDNNNLINWVFTINKIPDDISFPMGHPQANTLYVAHPAQKGMYLPFKGAEHELFNQRVREFKRLAQCLGAREITVETKKGESIFEETTNSQDIKGEGSYKGIGAGGSYSQTTKNSSQTESKNEQRYSILYEPSSKPYVPEDLLWLDMEPSWKMFIRERMEGGIRSFAKAFSSEESISVSNSLSNSVKASFQCLIAKADSSFDEKSDKTFSSSKRSHCEIKIEFFPLDELNKTKKGNKKKSDNLEE